MDFMSSLFEHSRNALVLSKFSDILYVGGGIMPFLWPGVCTSAKCVEVVNMPCQPCSPADDFESERADLLRRISSCSASASESHSLRCAAQKRAEEVRELQQALSAAHVHLFEERDRLLRLQAENDEFRLQEAEDRRRIQHLMSLTNPVDQEITLNRGAEPTSGILYTRPGPGKQKWHGATQNVHSKAPTCLLAAHAHAMQPRSTVCRKFARAGQV
jgi:hypothetical protein